MKRFVLCLRLVLLAATPVTYNAEDTSAKRKAT